MLHDAHHLVVPAEVAEPELPHVDGPQAEPCHNEQHRVVALPRGIAPVYAREQLVDVLRSPQLGKRRGAVALGGRNRDG